MKKIIFSLLIATFFFSSCVENKNAQLIIGNWRGADWVRSGEPAGYDADAVSFQFIDNGTYTYNYGAVKEQGTYKVENDMLFTTPEGGLEIMVKIAKLNADTLVFDMSRGGISESLVLIKKK